MNLERTSLLACCEVRIRSCGSRRSNHKENNMLRKSASLVLAVAVALVALAPLAVSAAERRSTDQWRYVWSNSQWWSLCPKGHGYTGKTTDGTTLTAGQGSVYRSLVVNDAPSGGTQMPCILCSFNGVPGRFPIPRRLRTSCDCPAIRSHREGTRRTLEPPYRACLWQSHVFDGAPADRNELGGRPVLRPCRFLARDRCGSEASFSDIDGKCRRHTPCARFSAHGVCGLQYCGPHGAV